MNIPTPRGALTLLAILSAVPAARAINVAGPAFGGSGICGVNASSTLTAPGTSVVHNGTLATINDGNLTTRVDTFLAGYPGIYSFVGVRWPFQRADSVKTLTFTMACFTDGGWFGFNTATPGAGNPLTSVSHLLEPSVQVTTDGGTTWTPVDATTDYLTVAEGHPIGGPVTNPTTKTFTVTLDTPISGINGIRLIGENGGPGDGNGFLGIFELEVDAGPVVDTEPDGMEDSWETAHGLNVGVNDSAGDLDTDGLLNAAEFLANTDPQDTDTDNDGLNDGPEVNTHFTNPGVADTDGDGVSDGLEVNTYGSNPRVTDSDGDGISDGVEVNTYGSNPMSLESDGDQYPDAMEVARGFNPGSAASRPSNMSILGTAVVGVNDAVDGDLGIQYAQQVTATVLYPTVMARLTDEDFRAPNGNTRCDTAGAQVGNYSYGGIVWTTARVLPVTRIEITLATFADGGWFGTTASNPAFSNGYAPLTATQITAATLPVVQITTTTTPAWTTVTSTTSYLNSISQGGMVGHKIGGQATNSPTARTIAFDLDAPASSVTGIRVIGREGGTSGATPNQGFLGFVEIVVRDTFSANDVDNDGLSNAAEATAGTRNDMADTDGDGLTDGAEINTHHTNPLSIDSDGDLALDVREVAAGTDPMNAASRPTNIARCGEGLTGVNNAVTITAANPLGLDTDTGTGVFNSGTIAFGYSTDSVNINDGSLTTRVDTLNGTLTNVFSYAGIRWPAVWPNPISRLELTLATFVDGGWFGTNALSPAGGGVLTTDHINAANLPSIQTSADGLVWANYTGTIRTNYISRMLNHVIGGGPAGNPTRSRKITFTLNPPATGARAIRIIGREGGTAGGGFVGIFELAAEDTTTDALDDFDRDGLTDAEEIVKGTNQEEEDTDLDGVLDGAEVNTYASNPLIPDTDGDGFLDGLETASGTSPTSKASFPTLVSLSGSGIMGVNDAIDTDGGTIFFQAGTGSLANIVDNNPTTRADNYNGGGTTPVSFVGVTWPTPRSAKSLVLNMATFGDGGWFGIPNSGPGSGVALTPIYLAEPKVQVTFDGTLWATVPHTSNYLTQMNGHIIGVPNPSSRISTFTLNQFQRDILGIRIIGTEGGTASFGFIGTFGLDVFSGGPVEDEDNDGLPDEWEVTKFGDARGHSAFIDEDTDGLTNFMEYAFDTNPAVPDSLPPTGILEGGYLTATITKRPGAAYSVLSGADLTDFSTLDTTVLIDDATTLKVRDNTPVATGPRRYLKTTAQPSP